MKRMNWLLVCTLIALVFASGNVSVRAAGDRPDPSEVFIKRMSWAGTGCAPRTAVVRLAPDRTAFTLIFSNFLAEVGPEIPLSDARRNCQANLTLQVPAGFTFAVASVDYRGFANIARGAKGMQKATYYFQGDEPQASTWRVFKGPFNADWHLRDEVDQQFRIFRKCGVERSLNINAQVRLEKGSSDNSPSMMAMDSESIQKYYIRWRACRE